MFSPEFYVILYETEFDDSTLATAAILNLRLDTFIAGAGITKWFYYEGESSDLLFKANAGFRGNGLILIFSVVSDFDDLFKNNRLSATLGFEF